MLILSLLCHTKSRIRKHLFDNKNVSCLEQAEEKSRRNTLNEALVISSIKSPTVWRSFNDAILHASNESFSSHVSQRKVIAFAGRLRQYPIGLSLDGNELNDLVLLGMYTLIPDKPTSAIINKPTFTEEEISNRVKENLRSLPPIVEFIKKSGFEHIIGTQKYAEPSENSFKFLNKSWDRFHKLVMLKVRY